MPAETAGEQGPKEEKPCTSEQARLQTIQQTSENVIPSHENTFQDERKLPEETKQHLCIVCAKSFKSAQELGRHTRNCQPSVIASVDAKQLKQLKETVNEQGERVWICDLCDFK